MMRFQTQPFKQIFGLVRLLFAGALLILPLAPFGVLAQSTDDGWTDPQNISRAGLALNPSFVVDSDGVGHALWQDDLANYLYAQTEGDGWTAPKLTTLDRVFELPTVTAMVYTGSNPVLIAGRGEVFAFWLTPEGELFRSKVKNEAFGTNTGWSGRRTIASDAASFSVALDARGEVHLAYVRTTDDASQPAGIYYTRSKNSGTTWGKPVLLYESPYLHTLLPGEGNLSVAATGTDPDLHVYVAWDNRPRKQVFLAQSKDGGGSWEPIKMVAGPEPSSGAVGPFNIHVGANNDSVVLVWQTGLPGGACSQLYQSSSDAGVTWSDPRSMIQDLSGCAESNQFVSGLTDDPDGPLYFLTETKNQVFLTAWDGKEWSQSQSQPILSGFEEPEIYTQVLFGCHRAALYGDRLYVVGCDLGDAGDIWATSRDLASFKPPVWSQLVPVTSDNLALESVDLVSTDDGMFHAFFTHPDDPTVYYTFWDGLLWSRRAPVFESPEGDSVLPTVVTGLENELFLIARNNRGTLYFSRATSGNAAAESRWSKPARLETGHFGEIGAIDVAWDAGAVYVAYSVPVNEERGIYLIKSEDHGTTWSEPVQVFNGAGTGSDLVGVPALLVSDAGLIHVLWDQQSIQADGTSQPLSLYYARSEDGGRSFNEPQVIVDEPVDWRAIVADVKGNLHLLWQPHATSTVWDQLSTDSGSTWEYPQGLPNEGSLADVIVDSAGRLQLVGVGPSALGHWSWDGNRWQSEAALGWVSPSQQDDSAQLLASTVNKQGKMMVVLGMSTTLGDTTPTSLLYSTRMLQPGPKQNTTQKDPTPTTAAPTSIPATTVPQTLSTPTAVDVSALSASETPVQTTETSNRFSPLTMALVPVGLLLISILGIVIWRAAQAKDR